MRGAKLMAMAGLLGLSGGMTRSDTDCGSRTPHGYYGIEDKVVDGIARWPDAHSR